MATRESGDQLVVRRPHVRRSGDALYFLISSRPMAMLSADESRVWDALESPRTEAEISAEIGAAGPAAVDRLHALGACELAPVAPRRGRTPILVVEPHSDDAVLSLGGVMWARRDAAEFTIATVAGRSNFSTYFYLMRDFFDVARISSLRADEGRLAARMIGGRYVALDEDEATLRYHGGDWSLDWFRAHSVSARTSIGRRYSENLLPRWTRSVARLLRESDAEEIWMPLGIGHHADHQLCRDACLTAICEDPALVEGKLVRLYEEVPYASRHVGYARQIVDALTAAGGRVVEEVVDVTDVFEQKLRLTSVYASQFKISALEPDIRESAQVIGGDGVLGERLWRLDRLPDRVDPAALSYPDPIDAAGRRTLRAWHARHRDTERMRLLLLLPSGRWEEDAVALRRAFPNARIDVHVTRPGVAELHAKTAPGFAPHAVERGPRGWVSLALRLAVSRPMPTAFCVTPPKLGLARKLSALWPFCDTVVVPSIDTLLGALDDDASAGG